MEVDFKCTKSPRTRASFRQGVVPFFYEEKGESNGFCKSAAFKNIVIADRRFMSYYLPKLRIYASEEVIADAIWRVRFFIALQTIVFYE